MSIPLSNIVSAVAALCAVLGLVLLAARWARSAGLARGGTGQRLTLLETLALDRVRRLHVVRCDGREVLLLTGGPADQVVGWLSAGEIRS